MGFIKDELSRANRKRKEIFDKIGESGQSFIDDVRGKTSANAALESSEIQAEAGEQAIGRLGEGAGRAQEFLSPFDAVGQRGLSRLGELDQQDDFNFQDDPQADFDFLQNNPLFKFALENANRTTGARAASGSRINAGDTLSQLTNNVFLQASPLLDRKRRDMDRRLLDRNQNRDRQRQDIFGLLDRGIGVAGRRAGIEEGAAANEANLLTGIGATRGAGLVGAANARQGGLGNLINLGGLIAGGISSFGGAGGSSLAELTSANNSTLGTLTGMGGR